MLLTTEHPQPLQCIFKKAFPHRRFQIWIPFASKHLTRLQKWLLSTEYTLCAGYDAMIFLLMGKLEGMCTETCLTNKKIESQKRLNTLGVIFIANEEKAARSWLWDSKLLICTITRLSFLTRSHLRAWGSSQQMDWECHKETVITWSVRVSNTFSNNLRKQSQDSPSLWKCKCFRFKSSKQYHPRVLEPRIVLWLLDSLQPKPSERVSCDLFCFVSHWNGLSWPPGK